MSTPVTPEVAWSTYSRGLITLAELITTLSEIDRAETAELLARADALGCVGFADCPCKRCRATRVAATATHPDHSHPSEASYCGACRTAELARYRVPA